jgi:hypothetical protein
MPTAYPFRTYPRSRAAAAAAPTTGSAIAIDRDGRVARIKTSAAAYVGVGASASVPAASASNSVYHASGTEDYTLNPGGANMAYLYVYAVAGTVDVEVSFLG